MKLVPLTVRVTVMVGPMTGVAVGVIVTVVDQLPEGEVPAGKVTLLVAEET